MESCLAQNRPKAPLLGLDFAILRLIKVGASPAPRDVGEDPRTQYRLSHPTSYAIARRCEELEVAPVPVGEAIRLVLLTPHSQLKGLWKPKGSV